VGELLFLLEVATAFAGGLYGINAFDQPGVEEGKIAAYALMGREGKRMRKSARDRGLSETPPDSPAVKRERAARRPRGERPPAFRLPSVVENSPAARAAAPEKTE
jgi:hypothetical protein